MNPTEHPLAALALPLVAEVRAAVDAEKDPQQQAGILLILARAHKTLGDPAAMRRERDEAVVRARRLPFDQGGAMLWPALVFDTDRLGDRPGARALLAEGLRRARAVKAPRDRFRALGWMAQMQGVLKDRAGMEATLAEMRRLDPKQARSEDGLWMEAVARSSAGDVAGALRVSSGIKPGQRAGVLAQLSTRQRKAGDRAGAARTMALAWQVAGRDRDPQMRSLTHGLILGEMVAQGDAVAAIKRAGRDPKLRREVAEALLAQGQRERALVLEPPASPSLVYAHAQAGSIDEARETMRLTLAERGYFMQDDPIRMLGAIAAAEAKAGNATAASAAIDQARTQAKTPDDVFGDRRGPLLASLLDSLLNGGWRDLSAR